MARLYSDSDPDYDEAPGIIGQVSGPTSWSEFESGDNEGDCEALARRNVTPLREGPGSLSDLRNRR